jgi:zinc protease
VAEQTVDSEIEKIRTQKVSELDLRKAKNQIMKDFVDGLTTIDGKAQSLAVNEILFSDYKHLFSDLEDYEKVTANEVMKVSQKYLNPQQKVTAILNPKGKK